MISTGHAGIVISEGSPSNQATSYLLIEEVRHDLPDVPSVQGFAMQRVSLATAADRKQTVGRLPFGHCTFEYNDTVYLIEVFHSSYGSQLIHLYDNRSIVFLDISIVISFYSRRVQKRACSLHRAAHIKEARKSATPYHIIYSRFLHRFSHGLSIWTSRLLV